MNDREMLELAAKAGGYEVVGRANKMLILPRCECGLIIRNNKGGDSEWCPRCDDGDALRLAVKLRLNIFLWSDEPEWVDGYCVADSWEIDPSIEGGGGDPFAATRRAITRAAASIAAQQEGK
jgi:hypothetical protein